MPGISENEPLISPHEGEGFRTNRTGQTNRSSVRFLFSKINEVISFQNVSSPITQFFDGQIQMFNSIGASRWK